MQPDSVPVPLQLAEALHQYLLTRPMREVENLVTALRQCEPVAAPARTHSTPEGSETAPGPSDV